MTHYDTIILGSSPNALTAACYLARSGKKVLVLEQSVHLGGAVSTAEFATDFKGDVGLTSGHINAEILQDLKLTEHGLEIIERNSITSLLPDGKTLTLPSNRDAAVEVIKTFSASDASKYKPFMELVDKASEFLKSAYEISPPQNHPATQDEIKQLSMLTAKLKGYGPRESTEVMRLLVMSIRDLLDEWFESDALKGLFASVAIRGLNQGPFAGSTTFNFLHQIALEDGCFPATARGGVGALSEALSNAAKSYGVEIRTGANVSRISIVDGVAVGVLVDTENIEAKEIISDYDARFTFTKLVEPPDLEPEFNRAVRTVRYSGAVARINFALSAIPNFSNLSSEALSGTVVVAPSIAYLEHAFDGGKYGAISEQPYMEITIPSLKDASFAPAGKHVMSVWMQYVPYSSQAKGESLIEIAINQLSAFCPNLKSNIISSHVRTPAAFESEFNLSEGNLFGGEVTLSQAFYLRPVPGFAHYHTPISNLYLCGATTHPSGISGISGHNAAREIGLKTMVPA